MKIQRLKTQLVSNHIQGDFRLNEKQFKDKHFMKPVICLKRSKIQNSLTSAPKSHGRYFIELKQQPIIPIDLNRISRYNNSLSAFHKADPQSHSNSFRYSSSKYQSSFLKNVSTFNKSPAPSSLQSLSSSPANSFDYNRSFSNMSVNGKSNKEILIKQKWNKCLQLYMKSKQKMVDHLRIRSGVSWEFQQLQLDRRYRNLKQRKLAMLQSKNKKQPKLQTTKFLSNLISPVESQPQIYPSRIFPSSQHQNSPCFTSSSSPHAHRCDALLLNFVSTYFHRKFYKKTRKGKTIQRFASQEIVEGQVNEVIQS